MALGMGGLLVTLLNQRDSEAGGNVEDEWFVEKKGRMLRMLSWRSWQPRLTGRGVNVQMF